MEGVILFADDAIFQKDSFENEFFNLLNKEQLHSVLPIDSLFVFEKTIKSVLSFRAIILDWEFEREKVDEGMDLPPDTPEAILLNNEIFSLFFIYTRKGVAKETVAKLEARYNAKIEIIAKPKEKADIQKECLRILEKITEFESTHPHLTVPFLWSNTINKSVQSIFFELNKIDKNWISDLFKTAENDGVEPSVEVINLFQNLLAERVIQSKDLRDSIKNSVTKEGITEPEKYAKLFRTFLYSYLDAGNDPLMTGDIFKFEDDKFGILITPECDISKVKNEYEFLIFKNNNIAEFEFLSQFNSAKKALKSIVKEMVKRELSENEGKKINTSLKEVESNILQQVFNQPHQRLYILPCFDSGDGNHKTSAQIDFRDSLEFKKVAETKKENRICKLNSPYIQDLRQRFMSYKGRVGVPSFPDNLRSWLLGN